MPLLFPPSSPRVPCRTLGSCGRAWFHAGSFLHGHDHAAYMTLPGLPSPLLLPGRPSRSWPRMAMPGQSREGCEYRSTSICPSQGIAQPEAPAPHHRPAMEEWLGFAMASAASSRELVAPELLQRRRGVGSGRVGGWPASAPRAFNHSFTRANRPGGACPPSLRC